MEPNQFWDHLRCNHTRDNNNQLGHPGHVGIVLLPHTGAASAGALIIDAPEKLSLLTVASSIFNPSACSKIGSKKQMKEQNNWMGKGGRERVEKYFQNH